MVNERNTCYHNIDRDIVKEPMNLDLLQIDAFEQNMVLFLTFFISLD